MDLLNYLSILTISVKTSTKDLNQLNDSTPTFRRLPREIILAASSPIVNYATAAASKGGKEEEFPHFSKARQREHPLGRGPVYPARDICHQPS